MEVQAYSGGSPPDAYRPIENGCFWLFPMQPRTAAYGWAEVLCLINPINRKHRRIPCSSCYRP